MGPTCHRLPRSRPRAGLESDPESRPSPSPRRVGLARTSRRRLSALFKEPPPVATPTPNPSRAPAVRRRILFRRRRRSRSPPLFCRRGVAPEVHREVRILPVPLVDVPVPRTVTNASPTLPRRRRPPRRASRHRRRSRTRSSALDSFPLFLACSRCNPRINPWPDARFRVFPGEVAARRRRASPESAAYAPPSVFYPAVQI